MKLQIDKQKFITSFEESFHDLNDKSEAGLSFLIDKLNKETRLKNIQQFAYFLATVYHESSWAPTASFFVPIKEGKSKPGTKNWDKYQSKYWGSGYFGRGYVQTTLEPNYRKAGELLGLGGDYFIDNPNEMLKPEFSYETAIISMTRGLYRYDKKKKRRESLDVYIPNEQQVDYLHARNIINGDLLEHGAQIANHAMKFERLLKACSLEAENNGSLNTDVVSIDQLSGSNSVDPIPTDNNTTTETTIKTETADVTTTSGGQPGSTADFTAYIPQIETAKKYIKKGIVGSVTGAIASFWLGLPLWIQIAMVMLVVSIVVGSIYIFIRYHDKVFAYVTTMNTLRATQGVGNPILKAFKDN